MYCDPKAFTAAIQSYQKATGAKREAQLEHILINFCQPIAKNICETYHWRKCQDVKDDFMQDAMARAAVVLQTFTTARGKAFAFTSKMMRNKMLDALDKESRWTRKKAIHLEFAGDGQLPERFLGDSGPQRARTQFESSTYYLGPTRRVDVFRDKSRKVRDN